MSLPFAVRLRAHAAGLDETVARVATGGRDAQDLVALAAGPLPLLAAVATSAMPREARVVGLLPYEVGTPVEKVLAHRAAAEAEVLVVRAPSGADLGEATHVIGTLLRELRGAVARIDSRSLASLAAGAGVSAEAAAARLGVMQIDVLSGDAPVEGLEARFVVDATAAIDAAFVEALIARPSSSLFIGLEEGATGVALLRAVAVARLAGHGPIAVGGFDELKGPDACLAFGADHLEAQLDPPGSMGSRTRAYGEAAVRGAQLAVRPPRRRAAQGKAVAHILDEHVDPEALPGGDVAAPLPVVAAARTTEVRS